MTAIQTNTAHDLAAAREGTHDLVMHRLCDRLDLITSVIPSGSKIVYIDYPLHFNVGDLLIHLGTERFFEKHRYDVMGRFSIFDVCLLDWTAPERNELRPSMRRFLQGLPADVVLVFHGGGNFGDIYPEFQKMRELVVELCQKNRIVFMPQSMHFRSTSKQAASLSTLAQHPDLHCFFRDRESLEIAQHHALKGQLCPDMAHALWDAPRFSALRQARSMRRSFETTLVLARGDDEVRDTRLRSTNGQVFDWPDIESAVGRFGFRLARKLQSLGVGVLSSLPLLIWQLVRDAMVARAGRRFIASDRLITDRLHGMILAALLDLPTQVSDNEYGKLSRYRHAWLADSPNIREWQP